MLYVTEMPIEIEEEIVATPKPTAKKGIYPHFGGLRTLAIHHGPNRHQRRHDAKTARTQPHRDAMRELKIVMNRINRDRYRQAVKRNIGGQFYYRGVA